MSGPFVIVVLADALGREVPGGGRYLASYDPDAHDGRGDFSTTSDPAHAMRFDDAVAAFECWKAQSSVRPTRPDGKPNRPLTALTVNVRSIREGDR